MARTSKSDGKYSSRKELPAAGAVPETSAMIGGISNRTNNPSAKKEGARGTMFNRGGAVRGGLKSYPRK